MSGTYRLFFALWPDDATRQRIAEAAQLLKRQHPTPGRWLSPQRYHLTLHFLGDYPLPPEAWARRAMDAADSVHVEPIQLRLDQAGCFQNGAIPWWLGPASVPDALRRLWRELREALRNAGLPHDTRPRLTPHLTVLRDAGRSLPTRPIPPVDWRVPDFVLIESRPGTPADYRVRARWPLQAPAREAPHAGQLDLWDNPGAAEQG